MYFRIIGRNRSDSASDSAYCYTFLRSAVCLSSVVSRIRAFCLNRSTDLDAIWQVHLWGPVTHCGAPDLSGEGKIRGGGSNPAANTCNCCRHLTNRNEQLCGLAKAIPLLTKLFWTRYCWHKSRESTLPKCQKTYLIKRTEQLERLYILCSRQRISLIKNIL